MIHGKFESISPTIRNRQLLWLAMLFVIALAFGDFLVLLAKLALAVDHYSHILFIPFAVAFLLHWDRRRIFSAPVWGIAPAALTALLGLLAIIFSSTPSGPSPEMFNAQSFTRGIGMVLLVWSSFILCYGIKAFQSAGFPMLLLCLAVPLPFAAVEQVITFLQNGSTALCHVFFAMTGVPFVRDGVVFYLPNLAIEIAKECSGIRSSMALLITTMIAAHLLLKSAWKKALVIACVVPLVLVKNALRIVSLSLLTIYVDPQFMTGWLHTSGGIVFYLIALAMTAWLIRALEPRSTPSKLPATATGTI